AAATVCIASVSLYPRASTFVFDCVLFFKLNLWMCVHWGFNKIIGRVSNRALTNIIVHFAVIVIINFECVACVNSDSSNYNNYNNDDRQWHQQFGVQPVNYCAASKLIDLHCCDCLGSLGKSIE
ncbi:hypothetical protein M5D96_003827, partial [Drosophila gunungcola]